jgi:uncharacterized protein
LVLCLPSSKVWLTSLIAVLWLLCAPWAAAEVAVPPLKARVTDLTGTLQPDQQAALEQTLQAFENQKGSQIAVLIVPTTQPETIEQYAIRVAEAWKLGRKGVDDGVLLLIARNDRKLRVEVGYGLEGAIPDAVAKRIVSEIITPHFKQDDYFGGIRAGVDRIIKVIEGEPLPEKKSSRSKDGGGVSGDWLAIGFVLAVVVGGAMRALLGPFVGGLVAGSVAVVVAWLLFASLMMALVAGLFVFIFTLLGRHGGGGWSSGGGGGWSGGSGGGFGGGGGGFGGGGASGNW